MAMVRHDSFDYLNTAQLPRRWFSTFGTFTITANGRNGTNALTADNRQDRAQWAHAPMAEAFEHFAIYWPHGGDAFEDTFLTLYDNTTAQLTFRVRTDRLVEVHRGAANGTSLGITSLPLPLVTGALQHLQARWVIHNSAGVIHIKINDTDALILTGQDTQVSANAYATMHVFGTQGGFNAGMTGYIDDYICNDPSGSVNNGFLGDKRVKWCPALAEGAQSDYTPSAGSDNAAMVDESPADDDTTNIESSTVGHIDYVTISVSPAIPAGSTIHAVGAVTQDRKTDGGTRTARHKIRFGSGPTVSNGAAFGPTTSYEVHVTTFEDEITVSEVNAPMQVGVEVMT